MSDKPWFVVSVPGEEDQDAALQKLKTKIQSANASEWASRGPGAPFRGPPASLRPPAAPYDFEIPSLLVGTLDTLIVRRARACAPPERGLE